MHIGTSSSLALQEAIIVAREYVNDKKHNLKNKNFILELSDFLYINWYTKSQIKKKFEVFPHKNWGQIFNTIHEGRYEWEKGWKVLRVSNIGRIVVTRKDEERMLYPGDYISPDRLGILPSPGMMVEVVSSRTSLETQEGFWISYSSTWSRISKDIIRIYWNVSPEGSIHLIKEITKHLNNSFPYSFKVPIDEIGYYRADTVVLYFTASDFQKIQVILKSIHKKIKPFLYPETPAFTKVLEEGIGLAEEPLDNSESFGMNRCRLIAQGYTKILEKGLDIMSDVDIAMQKYLADEGVNLLYPYLNKGSTDTYAW